MKRMKRFPQKKILSICLAICLGLAGCGSVAAETEAEDIIELHEPKIGEDTSMNTEPVACRNLYNIQVYTATVFPYIEEYSYDSSQVFGRLGAVVGDTVQVGSPLVYMDTEAISERIKTMEEKIRSLTESYEEYRVETEEALGTMQHEQENLQEILDELEEEEPEEYIIGADGQMVSNPAYVSWQRNYAKWESQYSGKELSVETRKEALRQRTELYQLDYNYYSGQLRKLKEQEKEKILTSQMNGKVLAIGEYAPGDTIRAKTSIVAVGDMERKFIKCDYIDTVTRLRAMETYAIVNGKRYEVTYVEDGDTECALFSLQDENNNTSVGDAAVLVLVLDVREQVPTVSVDSIHRDGLQQYVYVVEDGKAITRMIQTGMSDDVYTEVLSGLELGEEVLVSQALVKPPNSAVVERGTLANSYGGSGELVYPLKTAVNNPIKNGTVYLQEYQVTVNQHVEKGDVIAIVRVEGDDITLARKEASLKRARERLADLILQGEEENEEAIAQRRESIADLEEEITQMRADYRTTEICATVSGRVLSVADYKTGDAIKSGNKLVVIADESVTFLSLDNSSKYLNYGDILELTYTDTDGQKRTAEGTVVSLGMGVTGTFASKKVLVALPEGGLENVMTARQAYGGSYVAVKINAAAAQNVMEDVVLVPKRTVTIIDGSAYVTVLKEDGTVMPISVVLGGANRDSYWVLDGLTEGMTICWE